jgi:mono/diheme cytochrome c family protein
MGRAPSTNILPGMIAPALILDSARSVAFIDGYGDCDLPTRRHAEESRPAPMQGRTHVANSYRFRRKVDAIRFRGQRSRMRRRLFALSVPWPRRWYGRDRERVQTILEESKLSERPVATIEHNALAQAHIQSSALIVAATLLLSSHLAFALDTSFGQRLFQDKADCQFCHGIDGDGRGDPRSPGRAANLHETHLNRDQLVEVIACGRPGTEMPHFDKYAYEDTDCYGLKGKNLGNDGARDPHSTSLTKREIEAVVDYILAKFLGK